MVSSPETFDAEWLALREPADVAARSQRLTQSLAETLGSAPVRVLDLAAGAGANLRYLVDALPPEQAWLLGDQDGRLLEQVPRRLAAWATSRGYTASAEGDKLLLRRGRRICRIETREIDFAVLSPKLFRDQTLVTASAWLDLVSERWVADLVGYCRDVGSPTLFALTYNGRMTCLPGDARDDDVRLLVNQHQRIDKGLGPALGPLAADYVDQCFVTAGYRVLRDQSDWQLAPSMRELQRQLVAGWAQAAAEIAPDESSWIGEWRGRRMTHIDRGESRIEVGHEDLLAIP